MLARIPIIALTLAFALLLAVPFGARAEGDDALYRARTIVTGQREPERLVGFGHCLEDVLVKVSGDLRLAGDARLAPMEREASHFVTSYRYHDRMAGIPLHDEQGTRDRPYDLFCRFNRAGVDALLASLRQAPWRGPRPTLVLFLGVHQFARRFVLARDGKDGADMRDALAAAAEKWGMRVVLPDAKAVAARHLTVERLDGRAPPGLEAAAHAAGGEIALSGTLVWRERLPGWVGQWHLEKGRRVSNWQVRAASFDAAFRNAVGGAMQILSGHGAPR